MSRKEGTPDRPCEEPEHDEVVHLQEIAARDANYVFDSGDSVGARRLALAFHVEYCRYRIARSSFTTSAPLLSPSVAIQLKFGRPDYHYNRSTMAWANSLVDAVPPKSQVRTLPSFSV